MTRRTTPEDQAELCEFCGHHHVSNRDRQWRYIPGQLELFRVKQETTSPAEGSETGPQHGRPGCSAQNDEDKTAKGITCTQAPSKDFQSLRSWVKLSIPFLSSLHCRPDRRRQYKPAGTVIPAAELHATCISERKPQRSIFWTEPPRQGKTIY
jgi:hypothetical protein